MLVLPYQEQKVLLKKNIISKQKIHIVGIRNGQDQYFSPKIIELIARSHVFSGGRRHRDLIRKFLPSNHDWILIKEGMQELINLYRTITTDLVIFASGDPLFYGIGNTLMRLLPNVEFQIFPSFNCIQLLCHRTQTNYNELKSVSVHGRDWSALDAALIEQQALIGVLTDDNKPPNRIAQRLMQYGYHHYEMIVGEDLDASNEKISKFSLSHCLHKSYSSLNCVLLKRVADANRQLGIADETFSHLDGRPNMITKKAIRLNTISALELHEENTFWDVGACTGSVAIEAKLAYPKLKVIAFEKRQECATILQVNCEKFGALGVEIVIGDFFQQLHGNLPKPDTVFIGGHGGRLKEMIEIIHQLAPESLLVTNAVQKTSVDAFYETTVAFGLEVNRTKLSVDDHNPIMLLTAKKRNY